VKTWRELINPFADRNRASPWNQGKEILEKARQADGLSS